MIISGKFRKNSTMNGKFTSSFRQLIIDFIIRCLTVVREHYFFKIKNTFYITDRKDKHIRIGIIIYYLFLFSVKTEYTVYNLHQP